MPKTNNILNATALELISTLSEKVPEIFSGQERISFLANQIKTLKPEHLKALIHALESILCVMIEKDASDIELGGFGANNTIWMRIHGNKHPVSGLPDLTEDEAAVLILSILTDTQKEILLQEKNIDFSYTIKLHKKFLSTRFRGDAYFDFEQLAMNMRLINAKVRSIESLGFHTNALRFLSHKHVRQGLNLITGITGSGKSSTLDAIIDWHNNTNTAQIIIIASPIEFVHNSKKCIIRHREVGKDVLSFKAGIIQALRQDLDIMVVGEMRDPETIDAALEVSDTGHKVFSTLHTSSAVESIDRIIAEVPTNEQNRVRNRLADVLTTVISQKLIPSLDGKRVMAKEVLIVTPNVRSAIKNNNLSEIYGMINQGSNLGMITMEQDLKRLVTENQISLGSGIQYANNKKMFQQIIKS